MKSMVINGFCDASHPFDQRPPSGSQCKGAMDNVNPEFATRTDTVFP